MTAIDFVSTWLRRYPQKKDEPDDAREQFRQDVTTVAMAVGDGMIDKFEQRLRGWKGTGRPTISHMWQCAQDVKPGAGSVKDGGRYAFQCQKCRTLLSENVGCPTCGQITGIDVVKLGPDPPTILRIHSDCWQCTNFKLTRGRHGPGCDRWGHHDAGDMCRDCVCSGCCSLERAWRVDPHGMMERQRAGRLTLAQHYPWIRQEKESASASESTPKHSPPPSMF